MIKKISAVVLALVLCLSVVLPALAAPTLSGSEVIGYTVELDKENYAAGDYVLVNVYLTVKDGEEWAAGALALGINSAAFDITETDNTVNKIKANAVGDDTCFSWYKTPATSTVAWQNATVTGKITAANDAAENALYDTYLKIVLARDQASGSHPNAAVMTNGVESAEINAANPFIQFKLKLRDGLADGTPINVGFTTGSVTLKHTYLSRLTDVGNSVANETTNSLTLTNLSAAADTATIGAAGPAVAFQKAQVKMALKAGALDTSVADPIQLRVTSVITSADFGAYFANTTTHGTDAAPTASAITSVGIVAYKGAAADFNEATAKALVTDGTAASNYAAAETDYISNASGDYTFGAIIKGSRADAFAADVTFLGFVKYLDASGDAQVIFYDAATTKTITDATVNAYIAANA